MRTFDFDRKELVNQVAVGSVNLHAIEASGLGIGSAATIVLDRALDLRQAQRSGLRNIDKPCLNDCLRAGPNRGRRHRGCVSRQQAAVRDSAHVPELKKDSPARPVYCIDDRLPAGDLLLRMDAWGVDITLSHGRDLRCLRDNQAGRCTLAVVRGCPRARHPTWHGAISGQWRHEDAIWQRQ